MAAGDFGEFDFVWREDFVIFLDEVFEEVADGDDVITLGDFFDIAAGEEKAKLSDEAVSHIFHFFHFSEFQEFFEVALVIFPSFGGAIFFDF